VPANIIASGTSFGEIKGMDFSKILIHISDRDKWRFVLGQVDSFVDIESTESPKVILVADGFAVGVCIACDRLLRQQMTDFVDKGFRIVACVDSLRLLNMRPENLPEFIGAVPSGMGEVIRLKSQGYQYIKA
jgi:intracellular sulfur oxidation DsrE/DsrF family protein